MTYNVQVKVMPLKELLDPQGKAVMGGLDNLGLKGIEDVRVGKNISLQVNAGNEAEAKKLAEEATKKLLANPVMEYFEIAIN
ncbi:MAG: phosphoribosylformylglycinamidine synthase subunit PurS [Terrimonas sp.]|nr:phosphoribosylformylglycinamidine synthase subunit PurS [Terrimonas sp.]